MTLTNLQNKARYLLGELTSTNYSDTNLNRALNDYYMRAIAIAIQSNGQWEVKGTVATTNIVDGQREYLLPATLIALKMIEANFTGNSNDWRKLDIVDLRNLGAISNYQDDPEDDSISETAVRIFDNSLYFVKPPKNAVTGGLKIYYHKEETELSSGSNEPSLPEHLHLYLVYGACLDYSLRIDDTKNVNKYQELLDRHEEKIKLHYTNRLPAVAPRLRPRVENYR